MTQSRVDVEERAMSFTVKAIKVTQPMGEFFIASIPHKKLHDICYFDVRRMLKERDVEEYLGIQRPLSESRAEELKQYVCTVDASFPTAIVLAVSGRCAEFDEATGKLELKNYDGSDGGEKILYRQIAKVLDGQHRIAGLEDLAEDVAFDLNVSIFIDIELEDQAYIFSIVNLAQTKVNKSLAYDLFELARSRSPQKTAHNVAVVLDRSKGSPLRNRIKRLGSATPGRQNEVLTQATVVEAILPLLSRVPMSDRDLLKRRKSLPQPTLEELRKSPLRGLFCEEKDVQIVQIIWNYFSAVATRWPGAWNNTEKGAVLARTNGFRALMRVFPAMYLKLTHPGEVPAVDDFYKLLEKVSLKDDDFNVDEFKPGSSGEAALASRLLEDMKLKKQG